MQHSLSSYKKHLRFVIIKEYLLLFLFPTGSCYRYKSINNKLTPSPKYVSFCMHLYFGNLCKQETRCLRGFLLWTCISSVNETVDGNTYYTDMIGRKSLSLVGFEDILSTYNVVTKTRYQNNFTLCFCFHPVYIWRPFALWCTVGEHSTYVPSADWTWCGELPWIFCWSLR